MTTQQHPITPPRELVEKWATSSPIQYSDESWAYELFIAHQAARWGADQELEACCKVLGERDYMGTGVCGAYLRAARRPKPPSLKELALEALDHICVNHSKATDHECTIRRALNELPDN